MTNAAGAAISGAGITFKEKTTGKAFAWKANEAGLVNRLNLPKGIYEITIVSPGFKSKTLTHAFIPNPDLQRAQSEAATPMGVVVIAGEVTPERQNPIKRFFSRIRHAI
jgi:hypothetical protein